MSIQPDGNAPYAPPAAVTAVLAHDRKRGIQPPITTDVIERVGVSSALAPRTTQALRLLDLIDDEGMPTEAMSALRKAPTDEYAARLADVLHNAYAPVFQYVDPREDGIDRVRDIFRQFAPQGMQERMVSLFLGLCAEAGIIDEAPRRRGRPPKIGGNGKKTEETTPKKRTRKTQPPEQTEREKVTLPKRATEEPLIAGLVGRLPEPGGVFPDANREEWVKAAQAIFNLIYKRAAEDLGPVGTKTTVSGDP